MANTDACKFGLVCIGRIISLCAVAYLFWVSTVAKLSAQVAELINVKLVDRDGDGLPDEDRERSNIAGVGFIFIGDENHGLGTAFAVGRRHLATVAHAVAKSGVWEINNSTEHPTSEHFSDYQIFIEGCQKRYQVNNIEVGTTRWDQPGQAMLDFAVVELAEDICPEVSPFAVGAPPYDYMNSMQARAVGFYRPRTVQSGEETSGKNLFELDINDHYQYTSSGINAFLEPIDVRGEQLVYEVPLDL